MSSDFLFYYFIVSKSIFLLHISDMQMEIISFYILCLQHNC